MSSSLKLLLFIPVLQLLHAPASSALECGVVGDCEAVLLDLSHTTSLDGCVISGKNVPGSTFVSWNSIAGLCEAYDSCEEIDDSETNSLTSSVDCKVCNAPGFCLGEVVDENIVEGEEECEQLCVNNEACVWFSYLQDDKFCLILAECSSLVTSCSNCFTSMKTCLGATSTDQPSTTTEPPTTTSASVPKNKMFYVDGTTVTLGKNKTKFKLNQCIIFWLQM